MAASAILLVDDDHDTCASLSDLISDLGCRVGVAHDGPAPLDQSRRPPSGPTALDSKMPGMDGGELSGHLRHVRANTVGAPVAVFAAAATVQAPDRAGTRRALPKPVDFGRLIPPIEEVTGARSARCRGRGASVATKAGRSRPSRWPVGFGARGRRRCFTSRRCGRGPCHGRLVKRQVGRGQKRSGSVTPAMSRNLGPSPRVILPGMKSPVRIPSAQAGPSLLPGRSFDLRPRCNP
jgi:CheY-like chemotaxis protein